MTLCHWKTKHLLLWQTIKKVFVSYLETYGRRSKSHLYPKTTLKILTPHHYTFSWDLIIQRLEVVASSSSGRGQIETGKKEEREAGGTGIGLRPPPLPLPQGTGQEVHCKDKMLKIWNKYSQKRNIGASVPITTFMCLWALYIFPGSICLFCWRKYVDRSWEYINRWPTHECGNWGWGRAIPRKGIYNGIAVAVYRALATSVTPSTGYGAGGTVLRLYLCYHFHGYGAGGTVLRSTYITTSTGYGAGGIGLWPPPLPFPQGTGQEV